MQRAVQCGRGAGERRKRIGLRAADAAHGVGAAILLVIGVEDEQHAQCALEHGIWLVLQFRRLEHHVQEIAFIAQVVVRIGVLHPDPVTIRECCNCRHLGDQPVDLLPTLLVIKNVLRIGIEGPQRA